MLVLIIYSLIGIAAATTAITLLGFNVDIFLSSLFYDPKTNTFAPFRHYILSRLPGWLAFGTCAACVILALTRYLPWRLPSIPGRAAVALTLSLMLGPGLLVNMVLKEYWDRPRPGMVAEFGGQHKYVDWWDWRGTCDYNCSFAAGEPAAAAWMFGPALLAPPPWRTAALIGAGVFTVVVSAGRLVSGGHFFSDIVFGVLIVLIILLVTHELVSRWPWAASGRRRGRQTGPGASSST